MSLIDVNRLVIDDKLMACIHEFKKMVGVVGQQEPTCDDVENFLKLVDAPNGCDDEYTAFAYIEKARDIVEHELDAKGYHVTQMHYDEEHTKLLVNGIWIATAKQLESLVNGAIFNIEKLNISGALMTCVREFEKMLKVTKGVVTHNQVNFFSTRNYAWLSGDTALAYAYIEKAREHIQKKLHAKKIVVTLDYYNDYIGELVVNINAQELQELLDGAEGEPC